MENEIKKKPSKLWYLLPIFLGIIGGIIGYLVIKDRDKKMAKNLLILSVVIFMVSVIVPGSIGALYYWGMFSPPQRMCTPCFTNFKIIGFDKNKIDLLNGMGSVRINNISVGTLNISNSGVLSPQQVFSIDNLPSGKVTIEINYTVLESGISHKDIGVVFI